MPDFRHEPDFSARALASGLAVGGLLCVANLYMGLKTGIWDSGHVTASERRTKAPIPFGPPSL